MPCVRLNVDHNDCNFGLGEDGAQCFLQRFNVPEQKTKQLKPPEFVAQYDSGEFCVEPTTNPYAPRPVSGVNSIGLAQLVWHLV